MILKRIKQDVEQYIGIPDIEKRTKRMDYVFARAIYYQIAKKSTDLSLNEIGKPVKRNHATVINGLRIFKELKSHTVYMNIYKRLAEKYTDIDPEIVEVYNEEVGYLDKEVKQLRAELKELQAENNALQSAKSIFNGTLNSFEQLPQFQQNNVLERFKLIIQMEGKKVYQ